jgi:hypothetical protein
MKHVLALAIRALRRKPRKRAIAASVLLSAIGSILTAALVAASTFHHRALPESTGPVTRQPPANPGVTQPLAKDKHGLHVIVFTLYDAGIEPAVLHTTKGLVAVSIEDHSGRTAGLVIERESGNGKVSIGQVNRNENQWRGRAELRLEPGRYHVFDSSRPDNEAEIVVDQ